MAFVYIITDKLGLIKIGKAVDVNKRLYELQTGNGRRLILWGTLKCESETDAFAIEKSIQDELKEFQNLGEWFEFNPSVVHILDKFNFEWKSQDKDTQKFDEINIPKIKTERLEIDVPGVEILHNASYQIIHSQKEIETKKLDLIYDGYKPTNL